MPTNFVLLAYFSPETMLPATSVVATVIGVVMMFGRTALRVVTRRLRRALPGSNRVGVADRSGPHFRTGTSVGQRPDVRRR